MKNTPAGRRVRAMEVTDVLKFTASPESSYPTGRLILVDGDNTIQEYKSTPEYDYI